MENLRYNISPCTLDEVSDFIQKIDTGVFIPNGTVKATDRSHYDRYSYLCDDSRVALVYDTLASILSITGRSDHANALLELFAVQGKTVKRSTVPAQGTAPIPKAARPDSTVFERNMGDGTRAKLFVSPDSIRRRSEFAPTSTPTVFVSSKGAIISTDEIYPPQTVTRRSDGAVQRPAPIRFDSGDVIYPPQVAKKRTPTPYGESAQRVQQDHAPEAPPPWASAMRTPRTEPQKIEQTQDAPRPVGLAISVGTRAPGSMPRKATISFGTEDDGKPQSGEIKINTRPQTTVETATDEPQKRKRGRPPKTEEMRAAESVIAESQKRKRGRPPKIKQAENDFVATPQPLESPEYKNGYSVKNFPPESLNGVIKSLAGYGKKLSGGTVEFKGTAQEVTTYTVTDANGQKVVLRYATKRMTLQLQGKSSDLFGEVMSTLSTYADYSSALENYVEESGGNGKSGKKVSDVQNKLRSRLPTAFDFLSEQSRIDFSYGIHDFGQKDLRLSDYSVLLVPAFRGLERFVFDLQTAENIQVKMIGQAFDKDDSGRYILKGGYMQRIKSVIYAEVLVALYTEYFSQRNFFAHSDNTETNTSRSIRDRATAQRIFDHLLDVVEYNAKKLKEIGYNKLSR